MSDPSANPRPSRFAPIFQERARYAAGQAAWNAAGSRPVAPQENTDGNETPTAGRSAVPMSRDNNPIPWEARGPIDLDSRSSSALSFNSASESRNQGAVGVGAGRASSSLTATAPAFVPGGVGPTTPSSLMGSARSFIPVGATAASSLTGSASPFVPAADGGRQIPSQWNQPQAYQTTTMPRGMLRQNVYPPYQPQSHPYPAHQTGAHQDQFATSQTNLIGMTIPPESIPPHWRIASTVETQLNPRRPSAQPQQRTANTQRNAQHNGPQTTHRTRADGTQITTTYDPATQDTHTVITRPNAPPGQARITEITLGPGRRRPPRPQEAQPRGGQGS